MKLAEMDKLQGVIDAMKRSPQTALKEASATRMGFELRIARARRELEVAQRASLLFNAYCDTGRMTAIHPNGQRMEGSVYTAVSPVQCVWNARDEAETLANWSVP